MPHIVITLVVGFFTQLPRIMESGGVGCCGIQAADWPNTCMIVPKGIIYFILETMSWPPQRVMFQMLHAIPIHVGHVQSWLSTCNVE